MKCRNCGIEFEPKKRGRKNTGFCCKHCADNYRAHEKLKQNPQAIKKNCEICGREFYTLVSSKRCCSKECLATYRLLDVKPVQYCKRCGKQFSTQNASFKYCSEECAHESRKQYKQLQRIERRHATNDQKNRKISIKLLYEKANGICGICGLPVPLKCDENDEWSQTRDLIVPVTKGGSHTYSNCQLAHRLCNSLKGLEDDYTINWLEKFRTDYVRWGEKLLRLGLLLNQEENSRAAAVFEEPGGAGLNLCDVSKEDRRELPRA